MFLKKSILILFIKVILVSYVSASDILVIEGTGDSQELLRALAISYEKKHPNSSIIIPNSIGSGGGIKKVINNLCEVGRVARPLEEKEIEKGLKSIVFAYSPVVFVINGDTKKVILSQKNIIDIFDGTITSWDKLPTIGLTGKIYIVDREPGDSSKSVLQKNIPKFMAIEKTVGIKAFYDQEAIQLLTNHKNTIGFLPISGTRNTNLKIVQLDGILPSLENIKNNKYKFVTPLALIYKDELKGLAKSFKDFLKSDEAIKVMHNYGVIPNL